MGNAIVRPFVRQGAVAPPPADECLRIKTDQSGWPWDIRDLTVFWEQNSGGEDVHIVGQMSGATGRFVKFVYELISGPPDQWQQYIVLTDWEGAPFMDGEALYYWYGDAQTNEVDSGIDVNDDGEQLLVDCSSGSCPPIFCEQLTRMPPPTDSTEGTTPAACRRIDTNKKGSFSGFLPPEGTPIRGALSGAEGDFLALWYDPSDDRNKMVFESGSRNATPFSGGEDLEWWDGDSWEILGIAVHTSPNEVDVDCDTYEQLGPAAPEGTQQQALYDQGQSAGHNPSRLHPYTRVFCDSWDPWDPLTEIPSGYVGYEVEDGLSPAPLSELVGVARMETAGPDVEVDVVNTDEAVTWPTRKVILVRFTSTPSLLMPGATITNPSTGKDVILKQPLGSIRRHRGQGTPANLWLY